MRRWIKVRLIMSIVMILAMCVGYLIFLAVPHRLMKNIEEELRGFTAEEAREIFEAYDITVPESEKNAKIYCFSRSDRGLGAKHYYVWCLEISGVRDYDGFFAANGERELQQSWNETTEAAKHGLKYYITYVEDNFSTYYSKNKKLRDRIGDVYEKMRTAKGYE